jgi:magnesium chelatase family protein
MIFYGSSISSNIEHENVVYIETNISERGLPTFDIYGLINRSIEESKKRILSSFESAGITFPLRNISINLSPAEIHKDGTHYDLAIAASLLRFTSCLTYNEKEDIFIGELSFDGSVKGVSNINYLVILAKQLGFKRIFVPFENISAVVPVEDVRLHCIKNIKDLLQLDIIPPVVPSSGVTKDLIPYSFTKILGNSNNKKILSYALSGQHHMLLTGFPGVGKSLLAKASADLIPDLNHQDSYEVIKIFSYSNVSRVSEEIYRPPFRSPHSSSSYSSLFGSSGKNLIPGELALSNKGILFLDELPEFNRQVLEGLRAPLEDKKITLSRAKNKKTFNTDFILIAATNPCKCGYFNHNKVVCTCSPFEIKKYQSRISGPLKDRIDILIKNFESSSINLKEEQLNYSYEEFNNLKNRVKLTRERKNLDNVIKSTDSTNNLVSKKFILNNFDDKSTNILNSIQEIYSLSNRKFFKVINLARTISYFNQKEKVDEETLLEALSLT